MKLAYVAFAAFLIPVMPAVAADPQNQTETESKTDKRDPDRIICRTQEETGSRLARKKVCMKASEWAELKRETRTNVDRAQTNRIKNN